MSAFDIIIAALFNDPNLAVDAVYTPQGAASIPVRVVMRAPDVYVKVGASMIDTPSQSLDVTVASCPNLMPGDQFMVNGIAYIVQGNPQRDELQLTWRVDMYAA